MTPPEFNKTKLWSDGDIYVVPIIINGNQTDLLVITDHMLL